VNRNPLRVGDEHFKDLPETVLLYASFVEMYSAKSAPEASQISQPRFCKVLFSPRVFLAVVSEKGKIVISKIAMSLLQDGIREIAGYVMNVSIAGSLLIFDWLNIS
jgi:hypothetical protein